MQKIFSTKEKTEKIAENGGKSVDAVVHDIWEALNSVYYNGELDSSEVKDIVLDYLSKYHSPQGMAKDLMKTWQEGDDAEYEEWAKANEEFERMKRKAEAEAAERQYGISLSKEVDQNGSPYVLSSKNNVDFGRTPDDAKIASAPIRMALGDIENGYIHIEHRHGDEIRGAGYKSVTDFVEYIANNFTRIVKGAAYDNTSGDVNQSYLVQLQDGHNNTIWVQLSRDGSYWNVNSAGIASKRYGNNKEIVWPASEVQDGGSATADNVSQSKPNADNGSSSNGATSNVSNSKGKDKKLPEQGNGEKNDDVSGTNATNGVDIVNSIKQSGAEKKRELEEQVTREKAAGVKFLKTVHPKSGAKVYTKIVDGKELPSSYNEYKEAEKQGAAVSGEAYFKAKQSLWRLDKLKAQYPDLKTVEDIDNAISGIDERLEANVSKDEESTLTGVRSALEMYRELLDREQDLRDKVENIDGVTAEHRTEPEARLSLPADAGTTSTQEEITSEEGKVNTEPTEGQKKAGNYKMGHIKVDGFDVTIENPKGSVRRGKDADGKEWESKMNNTYGYIRGTEGVDGDHIDVFLSDHPDDGYVFVIDQVNPKTGEFDEHKVMYGFDSAVEAADNYLANYEEGWQGLGAIYRVDHDEFKKWVNSSHRKTKPFGDYAGTGALGYSGIGRGVKKVGGETSERLDVDSIRRRAEQFRYDTPEESAASASEKEFFDKAKRHTAALSRKLGTKVNVIESLSEVAKGATRQAIRSGRQILGWYDTDTGEVYIYLPNIVDMKSIDSTCVHEIVAHKGLRQLLGQAKFDQLCDRVYASMDEASKARFGKYAGVDQYEGKERERVMADEYMAKLAEKADLSNSTWQRIVAWVREQLRNMGINVKMTDEDISDLLRRSYERLVDEGERRLTDERSDERYAEIDKIPGALLQGFGSAGTSLNQIPSGMKKIDWQPGTVNVDIGGGRFDTATEYMKSKGVENLVFDPFNRGAAHNKEVAERVRDNKVDTATCHNVLNVIDSRDARSNVILQAAKAIKPEGTAYFTVYEGDKSGKGRQTMKDSWQNNRPTRDYVDEISQYFDDVKVKNNVIIAKDPKETTKQSIWDFDGEYKGNDIRFGEETFKGPKISIDDYHIYTNATFEPIAKGYDNVNAEWEKLKTAHPNWKEKRSPISDSEYLIDPQTNDIYRKSGHWGRVSSCTWRLNDVNQSAYAIGKANIKDFERKPDYLKSADAYRTLMGVKMPIRFVRNMSEEDGKTADRIASTTPIEIENTQDLDEESREVYDFFKSKKEGWRKKVTDWAIKKLPESTETSFGTIEYRPAKIRGALSHGFGDLKMLTLPYLDKMFKNGVLYDKHNEGDFTYYNVAHRLTYQGDDYIVRLVAREDRQGNLFYDHEFSDIKKIGAPATGREEANKSVTSPHQLFAKVREKIESAKEKTEKSAENGGNLYNEGENEESKKIFEQAKKLFGTTRDVREAGYVLPDGSMLDFSGRHLMNPGSDTSFLRGRRTSDHREISSIAYEKDGNTKTGVETDMPDFIRRGAIRIDDNAGNINLSGKPTASQKEALRQQYYKNAQKCLAVSIECFIFATVKESFEIDDNY